MAAAVARPRPLSISKVCVGVVTSRQRYGTHTSPSSFSRPASVALTSSSERFGKRKFVGYESSPSLMTRAAMSPI